MLPYEILALTFSYLPPKDLDVVPQVCRLWYTVASDAIWKKQFLGMYGTNDITPVKFPFEQWRRELLSRRDVLHKWRKCVKHTDKTLSSSLKDVTNIYVNFVSEELSAVCFNSWQGQGVVLDLERGKIRRKLYASKYTHSTTPTSSVDGSRFGLMYGFSDGTVSANTLTRDSGLSCEFLEFTYRHSCAVSEVWVAKSRNFAKPIGKYISTGSGGHDGSLVFGMGGKYHDFMPCQSPVLLIEGCTSGSFTAQDGDSVAVLFANGNIYQYTVDGDRIVEKHIASLCLSPNAIYKLVGLFQCNGVVIVQTYTSIFVIELENLQMTTLDLPEGAEITAFSLDKSNVPGTKYAAAGLSTNEICVWVIPSLNSPVTSSTPETKIVVSRSHGLSKVTEPPAEPLRHDESAFDQRQLKSSPLWVQPNPIGFDQHIQETNRPQITQLAVNAAVLLVGGYNGRVVCVDVLSGHTIKRIDSRISKGALDYNLYSRDGLVPVTNIELDPDPLRLRGVIGVRPAVQFFDLGKSNVPKRKSETRKRGSNKWKQRDPNVSSNLARHVLEEELQLNDEFAILDAEADNINSNLRENFVLSDMEDQEQFEYAMMLSQQQDQENEGNLNGFDEEQLRWAIENSRIETDSMENESLQIQLSGQQDRNSFGSSNINSGEFTEAVDEEEELRRAIELSLTQS